MENNKNGIIWRWLVLISVFANIFINYWSNVNPLNGNTIGEVSNKYPTLFTPAGYAFSIWGLIYLSFVVYTIVQLLPSQRKVEIYDRLAGPFILTNVLSIIWIFCFSYEYIGLSVLIIAAMLVTAIVLFLRVKSWISDHNKSKLLSIPFSLYAGWLTVATIAAAATWLYSMDWRGGGLGEEIWAVIMIVIAIAIGIFVSWKFENAVYALVIAWASIAIWVARQSDSKTVALTALIAAIILIVFSIVVGAKFFKRYSGSQLS